MANANTFAAIYNLPAQTINATAETQLINAGSTVVDGIAASGNVVLSMPAGANFDGRPFVVRLFGKASGGTASTLQFKMYLNTTSGTNVVAWTVSGAAIPAAGGNFDLNAQMIWDSTSQALHGTIGGQTNGTITSGATLTNSGASIVAASNLVFILTATFGAALSTNTVTVNEFSISQI